MYKALLENKGETLQNLSILKTSIISVIGILISTQLLFADDASGNGNNGTIEGNVEDYNGELTSDRSGSITIRAYSNKKTGNHQGGSHYKVNNSNQGDCSIPSPSNTDFEDQAHAVACHYLFGHFNGGWTNTYSQDAADPWLGSYARGSDGELRPFLASTVGSIGGGLHGGGMFIPETMVPELLEVLNDAGDAIIEDTNNYVTYTFSFSTDINL